jgi:hypothetical protein
MESCAYQEAQVRCCFDHRNDRIINQNTHAISCWFNPPPAGLFWLVHAEVACFAFQRVLTSA